MPPAPRILVYPSFASLYDRTIILEDFADHDALYKHPEPEPEPESKELRRGWPPRVGVEAKPAKPQATTAMNLATVHRALEICLHFSA